MEVFVPGQNLRKGYLVSQREKAVQIQNVMDEEIWKIVENGTRTNSRGNKLTLLDEQKLRKVICSDALDQVIDLQAESPSLLTEVRNEYENFLNALIQGGNQYNFIYEQLKKVTTDPITLALLRKRRDELEKKITILNESNKKIADQILKLMQSDKKLDESGHSELSIERQDGNRRSDKDPNTDRVSNTVIAAVSLPNATDVQKLVAYSSKLQNKIIKLENSLKTQYTSKTKQTELKQQFCKKENIQHHLLIHNARLKERFENLKLSVESLKKNTAKPDQSLTMLGMVTKALENHREASSEQMSAQSYANSGIFEDDDPAKKRNEERLMDYIDTFNEMISAKEYDQAAKHAANSPKAILRTYEIMKIFKDINEEVKGISPQMLFCEALMITADKANIMSPALSCEVMKCALANQRVDLASHWLSKDCFKLSLPMANVFLDYCKCDQTCTCGSMNLAKEIFHKLGAHRQASLCLLSTGKIHQMIQYGEDNKFTVHDYVFLCKRYPSTKLLLFLISAHPEVNIPGLISFPYAVSVLLESDNCNVLSELLKQVYNNGIIAVDNSRKTLAELLFAECKEDGMSPEKWQKVVDFCTAENLDEIAEEILAVVTVRGAIDTAAYKCIMDYIS